MSKHHVHERISERIRQELSEIVEFELRDPKITAAMPTVMAIKLSMDRRYAKVYVALGNNDAVPEQVIKAFQRDQGFFRSKLAYRIDLRHTPELTFVHDNTVARALRLEQLLDNDEDEIRQD